jgi:hypothetical protein
MDAMWSEWLERTLSVREAASYDERRADRRAVEQLCAHPGGPCDRCDEIGEPAEVAAGQAPCGEPVAA